jgi:Trypsin-co-occurring domain 1
MATMVEYPLESGGSVLVAVEDAPGPVTRGWGEERSQRVAEQAHETFEAAVSRVRPAADAMLESLSGLRSVPDEITVEFAVQLTAGAGIAIATLGSTANFKIQLTWKPRSRPAPDAEEPAAARHGPSA